MIGYEYHTTTIKNIINKIDRKKLLRPSNLPSFDWPPTLIENLFNSILKGYPIGTFLFSELEHKIKDVQFYVFPKEYHGNNKYESIPCDISKQRSYAVIDGFQRLAALYIGFFGTYSDDQGTKTLYFTPQPSNLPNKRPNPFEFLTDNEYQKRKENGETVIEVKEFIRQQTAYSIYSKCNLPQTYTQQRSVKSKIGLLLDQISTNKILTYSRIINYVNLEKIYNNINPHKIKQE